MEKKDVHYTTNRLQKTITKLKKDVKKDNFKLIEEFLNDLSLGLVSRKRAGERTSLKVIFGLKVCATYFDKKGIVMNKIDLKDMKKFIGDLQNDVIKKQNSTKGYSEPIKSQIKKELKRFLRYKMGETTKWKKLCGWFDCTIPKKSIKYITEPEVKKLLVHANGLRDKTIIQVLFDGGMRAEEFLNIRFEDVSIDEETNLYTVTLKDEYSKTVGRKIFLYLSETNKLLKEYFELNKSDDLTKPIMEISYNALNRMLGRLSRKVLGRGITAHTMRRGSATLFASKLSHGQLCSKYGWAIGSSVPSRYVELSGVDQRQTAKIIKTKEVGDFKERLEEIESENKILKQTIGEFQNFKADFKEKTEEIRQIIFEQHRNKIAEMQL